MMTATPAMVIAAMPSRRATPAIISPPRRD
jgi:hypothetical protein